MINSKITRNILEDNKKIINIQKIKCLYGKKNSEGAKLHRRVFDTQKTGIQILKRLSVTVWGQG